MSTFRHRVRVALEMNGWDSSDLAKHADVSQTTVWRFIHNATDIRLSTAQKIASALDITLDDSDAS